MSTVVSSLSVVIGADTSGFTRGADKVNQQITSFGTTAAGAMVATGRATTNFGNSVSGIGSQITGLSQPFVALATSGLDAASNFEDVMTNLQVFGGLSGAELEAVRQKALQMGADTKFSASDAAGGMLELVKSGMSVSDSMTAMAGTMDLAAAGQISLDQSSGIIVTTLAQFGMGADQAGEAANVLASAALASRADVSTLADGLKNVGPVAAAAGLDLKSTAASLAVLANAGIDGAEAGTQLKSLLLNFNSDTAKKQFDDLGVSLYDAKGNTRDFDTVLDELKIALDAMTPEQRAVAMKNLAGSYGVTALNALLAQGGIDSMKTAMDRAPSAAEMAAKGMGTFSGKVESLKGSVETLMITGLTPLMDNVLTPLAEKVTGVVNSFTAWAEKNPETASTIGGIVLVIGLLGGVLTVVGSAVSLFGMAISGMGAVVGFVFSPIGLLALAIGGLVLVLNDPRIQEGLGAWQGVFEMLPAVIQVAAIAIQAGLDDASASVRAAIRDIHAQILEWQITATEIQIGLGINVDANKSFLQDLSNQVQSIDIAKQLESDINTGLASGGPITIDTGLITYITSGQAGTDQGGADVLGTLASQIADPTAIQQAIDAAVGSGDVETAKALIPLGLTLAGGPEQQQVRMQELLTSALEAGGPDGAAFNALLPLAAEMDIDVKSITDQYQAAVTAAAANQTFDVVVHANVGVAVDHVGLSEISMGVQATANASTGVPTGATGGVMSGDGLAYLHEGERVLTRKQTDSYDSGRGGSGGNTFIINPTSNVDEMVNEIVRRGGPNLLQMGQT